MLEYNDVYHYSKRPKKSAVVSKFQALSQKDQKTVVLSVLCALLPVGTDMENSHPIKLFSRLINFLFSINYDFTFLLSPKIVRLCVDYESSQFFGSYVSGMEKFYIRNLLPLVEAKVHILRNQAALRVAKRIGLSGRDRDASRILEGMVEDLNLLEEKQAITGGDSTSRAPEKFLSHLANRKNEKVKELLLRYLEADPENFQAKLRGTSDRELTNLILEFVFRLQGARADEEYSDTMIERVLLPFSVLAKELGKMGRIELLVGPGFLGTVPGQQRVYREHLLPIARKFLSQQYSDVHRIPFFPEDIRRKIQSYTTGYPEMGMRKSRGGKKSGSRKRKSPGRKKSGKRRSRK